MFYENYSYNTLWSNGSHYQGVIDELTREITTACINILHDFYEKYVCIKIRILGCLFSKYFSVTYTYNTHIYTQTHIRSAVLSGTILHLNAQIIYLKYVTTHQQLPL